MEFSTGLYLAVDEDIGSKTIVSTQPMQGSRRCQQFDVGGEDAVLVFVTAVEYFSCFVGIIT